MFVFGSCDSWGFVFYKANHREQTGPYMPEVACHIHADSNQWINEQVQVVHDCVMETQLSMLVAGLVAPQVIIQVLPLVFQQRLKKQSVQIDSN